MKSPEPYKSCACGAAYSLQDWAALRLVGYQKIKEGEPVLEMRECRCGSTLAVKHVCAEV